MFEKESNGMTEDEDVPECPAITVGIDKTYYED